VPNQYYQGCSVNIILQVLTLCSVAILRTAGVAITLLPVAIATGVATGATPASSLACTTSEADFSSDSEKKKQG